MGSKGVMQRNTPTPPTPRPYGAPVGERDERTLGEKMMDERWGAIPRPKPIEPPKKPSEDYSDLYCMYGIPTLPNLVFSSCSCGSDVSSTSDASTSSSSGQDSSSSSSSSD